MTPPTAAPGSAFVMRRQATAPHDANPSSFYVPSPLQQTTMGSQPDSAVEITKPTKKSWGERLKLGGKHHQDRPPPSCGISSSPDKKNPLQEYRNKYGTLSSSGSALSKSMKYAETWLYGSVAVRSPSNGSTSTARPSLFLYHHPQPPPAPMAVIPAPQAVVIPPGTNYAVVMCSCPEFLTGTARSKKNSSGVCKKCGGSRVLWNINKGGGGTLRGMSTGGGTLRLGGGSSVQNRVRPSLVNLQQPPPPLPPPVPTTPDPYDLMRRNRLGGVNNNVEVGPMQYEVLETCGLDSVRVRAKSSSPCRHKRRSPSPPSDRTRRRASRRDLAWEREYPTWNTTIDNSKRKSILECDVNAYELIAKYLKNGNRPPPEEAARANGDVLDDELSDDMSDNALENSVASLKNGSSSIPTLNRNRQTKTDTGANRKIKEVEKPTGVTLGGQRIRLFEEDKEDLSSSRVNGNGEGAEPGTRRNTPSPSSLIPRLASPRRPPRKSKTADGLGKECETESGAKEGACIIKSILKKPSLPPGGDSAPATFNDTVSKPDPSPAEVSAVGFYLPTFQEFKQHIRKKKQVQFKVLQPVEEEETPGPVPTNTNKVNEEDNDGCEVKNLGEGEVTVVNDDSGDKSASGDVPTTPPARPDAPALVGGINDDLTAASSAEDLVKGRKTVVTLRRSQSERLLPTTSGSLRGCDSRLQQSVDFNDTMRLRLRPGRPDIRQVFSDPGAPGTYTSHDAPKRMLSPARPRPKDPPPPPPPPSLDCAQQPLPELPPRQIFPFTKKQIEQMNNQARQFSIKAQNKQRKISSSSVSKGNITYDAETSVPPNIRPVSWSPLMESTLNDTFEYLNPVVKKKEHRHSDPGPIAPKIIVHIENSTAHLKESTESDFDKQEERNNSLPRMSSRNTDGKGSTIVTVSSSAPGSPLSDVHRLQITTEDVSLVPQRRTSILITNEETNPSTTSLQIQGDVSPVKQDSSNKVTICVGGGDTNLGSSCTIIDTSPSSSLTKSPKQKCSSLTVLSSSTSEVNVIPVSQEPVQRTLLVVDHHDNDSKVLQCWGDQQSNKNEIRVLNNTITIVDNKQDNVQEPVSSIVLTYKSRGTEVTNKEEDILLNPVEAVKRNLIPHVCGKRNETGDEVEMETSPDERLNKLIQMAAEADDSCTETMKEGDYCMAAAVSKLLDTSTEDSPPIYSNISSKSSEDTLPTVLEQDDEGDDDVFKTDSLSSAHADEEPTSINFDEEYEEDDDSRAVETSSSFPGDSSGCESAPSSIEPENEGTGEIENDSTATSHLHLSPSESSDLEKDNQEEVEIQEDKNESSTETRTETEDENVYESIKDPIYEEIPDTPPPLPLSPPPSLDDLDDSKRSSRSIFEGASKYDILSYLVGAKERGILPEELYYGGSTNGDEIIEIIDKPLRDEEGSGQNHQRMTSLDLTDLSSRVSHLSNASDSSEDSCNLIISNIGETPSSPNKVRKSSAEIERNDSGVGSETSKSSRSRWQHCGPACSIREDQQHLCEDCDQPVETQVTDSGVMFAPLVCRKCGKKRAERKEIIAEIVETEEKYGRDLQIIMEEFYSPMLVAGLLTPEQLGAIFLNVEELLEHNAALAEKLRDNLEIAVEQGDEDLLTVNIGKLFLEAAPMLHAFESYCVRQGAASLLLANLEKEKELLRIFLRVSQMENAVLRRMNLNSFLMVPVQRVTKYPLLLARLHKVTPAHHEGRDLLKQAQHKIELHLEHMNSEAKDISTTKLWRRISIMNGRRSSSETDMLSIKLRKMALDILEWNHDEVRFAMEGKLLYTNPADNNWRKSRTIKLNPINALLVTNGKPTEDYRPDPTEDSLMFPRKTGVREATLLLLKEKCGRYAQLRDPLYLERCIVCSETDSEEYFEVQELASKDTFIFKAEDGERTRLWYRQLQYHAQGMGAWRRRRNALANIMINGMQTRN